MDELNIELMVRGVERLMMIRDGVKDLMLEPLNPMLRVMMRTWDQRRGTHAFQKDDVVDFASCGGDTSLTCLALYSLDFYCSGLEAQQRPHRVQRLQRYWLNPTIVTIAALNIRLVL